MAYPGVSDRNGLNPASAAASAPEILNGFVLAKTPEFVLTQGFMQLEDGRRRIAASSGCISRSIHRSKQKSARPIRAVGAIRHYHFANSRSAKQSQTKHEQTAAISGHDDHIARSNTPIWS